MDWRGPVLSAYAAPVSILDRPDRTGLISNTSFAILSALAVNGFIAVVNPSEMASPGSVHLQPPGYVIGTVWLVLFAAMGVARWLMLTKPLDSIRARRLILFLLLFCLAYPFYTIGLKSEVLGLVGNLLTIALSILAVIRVSKISRLAAGLVSLVTIWVSFASVLVVEQLRWLQK
jgi:tryptophan-rich sensory protein